MIKRTVEAGWRCTHVKTRDKQIVFCAEAEETGAVPSEDIGLLILDSLRMTCTQRALAQVLADGGAVLVCGEDHLPAGLLLPLEGNELLTERLRTQIAAGKPQAKQLWRQIVQAKLRAQAGLLPWESAARLRLARLSQTVKSGDEENTEAQGARFYWPELFGADFRRDREGAPPNNLLNFGYMTLRAAMARAVVGAGLHPAIGLHHRNRQNAFCLADDLLEPYRPLVDARVHQLWLQGVMELDKESKASLLRILGEPIRLESGQGPVQVAMQKTAASLAACLAGERRKLDLPAS
ncbi:MAG: type II CRISPR-associated endonuclease Cas1 [Myxococcales bacterium]|nr:type II CRISPR-associated endonuclease Cas1 [Myxococcales bacterium]